MEAGKALIGGMHMLRINPLKLLNGKAHSPEPVLLAVTPPRTGERTLLAVENLLSSIAVPEPFSLELAGDAHGVTLMARCLDGEVFRDQIAAHYPQARIREVPPGEDPLQLREGEQAWGMTIRSSGPEYTPLRVFRDGDLLDPGSDPLVSLLGALSDLNEGERVVSRLLLRSLGPGWSRHHMEMAHGQSASRFQPVSGPQSHQSRGPGLGMVALGLGALAAYQGYTWVQAGEVWKTVLLALGAAGLLALGSWAWQRWKDSRSRVFDPMLIREKVSRTAFEAEIRVTAILPQGTGQQRAGELLEKVASAYRHYDNPAGARFRVAEGEARGSGCRPQSLGAPDSSAPGASSGYGRRPASGILPARRTKRPW